MSEFRREPSLLLFALDQQLGELLSDAMAGAPLRPADFAVTSVLFASGQSRPGDLARRVGMRPSSMSNHLRKLADARMVRRRTDPADGRAALVSLTAKGRRATEECFPMFGSAIGAFYENVRAEGLDQAHVVDVLEALSAALSKTIAEQGVRPRASGE